MVDLALKMLLDDKLKFFITIAGFGVKRPRDLSKAVTRNRHIKTAAVKTAGVVLNVLAVTLLKQTLKRSPFSWIAALI